MTVTIEAGDEYTIGSTGAERVQLLDDDARMTISIVEPVAPVREGEGRQEVRITGVAEGEPRFAVSFFLTSEEQSGEDSATSGVDYVPVSALLTFQPGSYTSSILEGQTRYSQTVSFDVEIHDDDHIEGPEIYGLYLAPGNGDEVSIVDRTIVMASILDDDEPGIELSKASLNPPEGGGESYTVKLTSQPSQTVTVEIPLCSTTRRKH